MYSNVVCDSVWRNENLWIFYNQHKLHCHEWAGNGTDPQSIVKLYIWFLVICIKNTEAHFGGKKWICVHVKPLWVCNDCSQKQTFPLEYISIKFVSIFYLTLKLKKGLATDTFR